LNRRALRSALALLLVLGCGLARPGLADNETQTTAEVGYLLEFVATSGCNFIRNGSAHDPADAADHLRLKYSRGKRYVNNAEQFIDRLASESSWTGKPYSVECAGETEPSRDWLYRALSEFRQRDSASSPE
jgi:hypothetical protein